MGVVEVATTTVSRSADRSISAGSVKRAGSPRWWRVPRSVRSGGRTARRVGVGMGRDGGKVHGVGRPAGPEDPDANRHPATARWRSRREPIGTGTGTGRSTVGPLMRSWSAIASAAPRPTAPDAHPLSTATDNRSACDGGASPSTGWSMSRSAGKAYPSAEAAITLSIAAAGRPSARHCRRTGTGRCTSPVCRSSPWPAPWPRTPGAGWPSVSHSRFDWSPQRGTPPG